MFDPSKINLDEFYPRHFYFSISRHKQFVFALKIILTLSHGQAAVGRGFSLDKSSLQYNIKEESIAAKKLVKDHPQANKFFQQENSKFELVRNFTPRLTKSASHLQLS